MSFLSSLISLKRIFNTNQKGKQLEKTCHVAAIHHESNWVRKAYENDMRNTSKYYDILYYWGYFIPAFPANLQAKVSMHWDFHVDPWPAIWGSMAHPAECKPRVESLGLFQCIENVLHLPEMHQHIQNHPKGSKKQETQKRLLPWLHPNIPKESKLPPINDIWGFHVHKQFLASSPQHFFSDFFHILRCLSLWPSWSSSQCFWGQVFQPLHQPAGRSWQVPDRCPTLWINHGGTGGRLRTSATIVCRETLTKGKSAWYTALQQSTWDAISSIKCTVSRTPMLLSPALMLQLTIWEYLRNTPLAKRPSLFHTIAPWIQYIEITWNHELTKLLIQRQWSFSIASWWRCLVFGNCILDSIIGQSENEIDSLNYIYTESWSLESKWPSYCFSCSFAFSVSPGTNKLRIVAFLGKFRFMQEPLLSDYDIMKMVIWVIGWSLDGPTLRISS